MLFFFQLTCLNTYREMIFVSKWDAIFTVIFQRCIAQVVSSNSCSLAEFDKFLAAVIFHLYVYLI